MYAYTYVDCLVHKEHVLSDRVASILWLGEREVDNSLKISQTINGGSWTFSSKLAPSLCSATD